MKHLTTLCAAAVMLLAGAVPAEAATQTVAMSGNKFNPATKIIARGDKVKWTNSDFDGHTSTGLDPLNLWKSPTVARNGSFTTPTALTAAGTYPYKCTIHFGMAGSIKVPLTATKSGRKITLTLASAPSGSLHKYVVQRKNGTSFTTLGTVTTATFVYNAPAAGTYQFRFALQKNGTTATAAFFSTPLSVSVT